MRVFALSLATVSILSACNTAVTAPTDAPPPDEGACGADGYQSLIGTNIAAITLPAELWFRVLYPDTAVTQEYSASRLNLGVDNTGTVLRVYCG